MFQIVSDGSCDLSPEQLRAGGIAVVPFYVTLDGQSYRKEMAELPVHDFYEYCVAHPDCCPRTSMPSVQDYMEEFEKHLSRGADILCYCITQKFSGSFQSAATAADLLRGKYPERTIRVTDSTLVTGLQGMLLLELSRYAAEGHTLEETWQRGEEIKRSAAIYFTIEDLTYLAKGGRIGMLANLAARSLSIRPVILFSTGELHPVGISMGRRRSFARVAETVRKVILTQGIDPAHYSFALGWGYDKAEAEPFFQKIRELFLELFGEIPDFVPIQIGATIGVHTGPYPAGIGIIEKA